MSHVPRFPVYIPSKGRARARHTFYTLAKLGVEAWVIVEEQEFAAYAAVVPRQRLLVLDLAYQRNYDSCDPEADAAGKSKGSGPARNFAWEHARAAGAERHWLMDDNIWFFYRLNENVYGVVTDATVLRCMEDFTLRYENVALAGPNYFMFVPRKYKYAPFQLNTRVYSCILIRNDIPFRWRARFNEDTDLSLRVLKAGWCTVLFNAFLCHKEQSQKVRGGNTEIYRREGTLAKSRLLVRLHPDVCTIMRRWNRDHHLTNYSRFRANKLVRREGVTVPAGADDYGMRLVPAVRSR